MIIYRELGKINSKASPQQDKNWGAQVLKKTNNIVSADKISQEITKYFEDIKKALDACQVCIRIHMASVNVLRLCNLQRQVLFRIERNTSDISMVGEGINLNYRKLKRG